MTDKLTIEQKYALAQLQLKADKEKEQAEEKARQQEAKKDESQTIDRWTAFVKAEKVLLETDMKFFRDSQPRYFRKLTTTSVDKKTKVEYTHTEVKFYAPHTLKDNWIDLKTDGARDIFRVMVEGGELIVKNPETNEFIEKYYEPKIYDKITNSLKDLDDKTYNMLDLSTKINPIDDKNAECPILLKALFYAISGNKIEWDGTKWVGDKDENTEWLEKWFYGTIHADIGNNMASFPVIFGPGKVGKNALFDIVAKQCLTKEACFSGTWDLFHGNFDGYKLGKVMMFIDEVPEKGSWDVLKNMTGSTDSFVKQKYGPEFSIENTVRYVVGANTEVYPLPVEDGPQMMRVSPMKTNKYSTFATNSVKMMDQEFGENFCRNTLKDSDDTLDVDSMDDFTVGDLLLRGVFNSLWADKEAGQKLLNYLHKTYKSETGNYSLAPLRGKDWDDIMVNKLPTVSQLVDYVCSEEIETISTLELYELYKIIQGNKNHSVQQMNGFSQRLSVKMTDAGYVQVPMKTVKGGQRVTLYTTDTKRKSFNDYVVDSDRFIEEVQVSSFDGGVRIKQLKHTKNVSDDDYVDNEPNISTALRRFGLRNHGL